MKKFLFFWLFFCAAVLCRAEAVVLLEKPALDSRFAVVDKSFVHDTGRVERVFVEQHPLVYLYNFREVRLSNGATGFRRDDVVPTRDGRGAELLPAIPVKRLLAGVLTALALAAVLLKGCKHGFKEWELLAIPILVRILLSLAVICKWDNVFTIAADENGYFEVAGDILSGNWSRQWRFTVGNPLLYIPFILFTGAEKFYDIVPYYNFFSLFVFAPAVLAIVFLILRKLDVSAKRACAAMVIWAVLPFVLFHSEEWSNWTFQHFFLHSQLFTRFIRLIFYGFCINSGFNAMSDTPGLLAVLGCFYFALAMPAKRRYALLFGAMYGFSALIRINYIILAPLFAFLLYRKFAVDWKKMVQAAVLSVAGFAVVFSVQLIANALQFGSPFTFGYVLHYLHYAAIDRPAAGFTWHTFAKLNFARFLLQVNLPVFALGTAALWTMRSNVKRTILFLASVPLILFFCGYSHTFCDGRRFVFPAVAAMLMAVAVAAGDICRRLSRRDKIELFFSLLLMVTLALPYEAPWKGFPLFLGEGWVLRIAAVVIPVYLTILELRFIRKGRITPAAFLTLAAIFYYAPSLVLGSAMLLLLPFIAVLWFIPRKSQLRCCRKLLKLKYQKFK